MSAEHAPHISTPLVIKLIAGTCALGMGMVAVATALSSSPGFLLIMIASITLNYGTVFIHQWLSHYYSRKDSSEALGPEYILHVLRNKAPLHQISKNHTGALKTAQSLWIGLASLIVAMTLAVASYFIFMQFVPTAVLLYTVATVLFFPIVFVVYRAFRRGIEDVWQDLQHYLEGSADEEITSPSARNTPAWIWGKRLFVVLGAISCVAGGLLTAALIHEGVATTSASVFTFIGGGLSILSGPIGWMMFSLLFVCVAGMMARSVLMFVKDSSLDEKLQLKHALFDRNAYLQDLSKDWVTLNQAIEQAQGNALGAQQAYLAAQHRGDSPSELQRLGHEGNRCASVLDALYAQKDTLYHRYTLFSKVWFQPLFAGITLLISGLCLIGMLAHMARGSQAGMDMITHVTGVSEKIAMGIATGIMWLGLVAETLFTVTNVTDTMLEEGIGTQTSLYEQKLETQQTTEDAISRFAYTSSRIQHGIFDGALVANGASGHATSKTGYAFADGLGSVGDFAASARSATERDPNPLFFAWNYKGPDAPLLIPLENMPDMANQRSESLKFPYNPVSL